MKKIPLHSLVVLVGSRGSGKTTWANANFSSHEIVSLSGLKQALCGDSENNDVAAEAYKEFFRACALRLEFGQRAVADATNLKKSDRLRLVEAAESFGAECYYVVFNKVYPIENNAQQTISQSLFNSSKPQISTGDFGRAAVLDPERATVVKFPNSLDKTQLLAIGDVHGNFEGMQKAVEVARKGQRHIIWLGDVVDYGRNNLKCVRLAYETVRAGEAHMIWGNHERKIDRWIQGNFGETFRGRLSDANLLTCQEILSLSDERRRKFLAAWNALKSWSSNHLVLDKFLFTHGAATPSMWHIRERRLTHLESNMAFFGEVDNDVPVKSDGYPNRVWNWVEKIPPDHTVVVGHDWLDRVTNLVVEKPNSQGGRAVVVDCGSSKGGQLAGMEIDLENNQMQPVYFPP